LVEQLTDLAQKYSDLKIKSSKDLREAKDRNKEIEELLKDSREYGAKMKKKLDETTKNSKFLMNSIYFLRWFD